MGELDELNADNDQQAGQCGGGDLLGQCGERKCEDQNPDRMQGSPTRGSSPRRRRYRTAHDHTGDGQAADARRRRWPRPARPTHGPGSNGDRFASDPRRPLSAGSPRWRSGPPSAPRHERTPGAARQARQGSRRATTRSAGCGDVSPAIIATALAATMATSGPGTLRTGAGTQRHATRMPMTSRPTSMPVWSAEISCIGSSTTLRQAELSELPPKRATCTCWGDRDAIPAKHGVHHHR